MKQEWSKNWISSVQPRKQRKYRFEAPLHVARDFLAAHLSKDLRKKYLVRAVVVRKGDKVKVMRGQFKGKIGNVEEVQIKNQRIAVEGVTYTKKDGKKMPYLLHPSKVMILELNLDDRKRKASIDRASKVKSAPKAEVKKAEVKIEAKPKSKEIKK